MRRRRDDPDTRDQDGDSEQERAEADEAESLAQDARRGERAASEERRRVRGDHAEVADEQQRDDSWKRRGREQRGDRDDGKAGARCAEIAWGDRPEVSGEAKQEERQRHDDDDECVVHDLRRGDAQELRDSSGGDHGGKRGEEQRRVDAGAHRRADRRDGDEGEQHDRHRLEEQRDELERGHLRRAPPGGRPPAQCPLIALQPDPDPSRRSR